MRRGERVLIVLPDVPPFAWVFFGTLARGCVVAMGNPDAPHRALEYLVELHARDGGRHHPARRRSRCASACARARSGARCGACGASPEVDGAHGQRGSRRRRATWATACSAASRATSRPSTPLRAPVAHAPRRARHLALHERLHRRAQGQRPLAPRLRLQHRGLRQAHRRLRGATTSPSASRASTSATRRARTSCSRSRSAPPSALFSERPTPESLARAHRDVPAHGRHQRARRCSASSSTTTRRCATRASRGSISSSVRFSLSAGEALPEPLLRRWLERFGSDVYDGIGSAEMFHIYASNRPGDVKPGSLGKAVEGYELRILPEDAEGPGARAVRAGRDRRALGEGRQREPRLLARPRQELAACSTATGAGRGISSASTTTGTSTSRAAPTSCSR